MAKVSSRPDREREREPEHGHEECFCEYCGREEDHKKKRELEVDAEVLTKTRPNAHMFTLKCRKSKRHHKRIILDINRISDAEETKCGGSEIFYRETDTRIEKFLVAPNLERVFDIMEGEKKGRHCD